VSSVQRVALLERAKHWLLLHLRLFLRERDVGSVSREVRVESATLLHRVRPWLVAVNDQRILLGVFVATLILFALEGVLRVANLVVLSEGVGLDASTESGGTLGGAADGRSLGIVLELRLADQLVGAGHEGARLGRGGTRLAKEVLTRVLERVAQSVALKVAESLLSSSALVYGHALVQTHFVALLAEGLVAIARVARSQTSRHRKQSVAWPRVNNTKLKCLKGSEPFIEILSPIKTRLDKDNACKKATLFSQPARMTWLSISIAQKGEEYS